MQRGRTAPALGLLLFDLSTPHRAEEQQKHIEQNKAEGERAWRRYLEKVMKFINRNAYIIVAVKGYSYCRAALRAMKLILNNFARLATVNIIGDALIFLGKLSVVAACGCAAFFMTTMDKFSDPTSDRYLSSPVVPVALACLAAYVVASIFFAVRRHFPECTVFFRSLPRSAPSTHAGKPEERVRVWACVAK